MFPRLRVWGRLQQHLRLRQDPRQQPEPAVLRVCRQRGICLFGEGGGELFSLKTEAHLCCPPPQSFVEMYDLKSDPHQLENIVKKVDPSVLQVMNQRLIKLQSCQGQSCRGVQWGGVWELPEVCCRRLYSVWQVITGEWQNAWTLKWSFHLGNVLQAPSRSS